MQNVKNMAATVERKLQINFYAKNMREKCIRVHLDQPVSLNDRRQHIYEEIDKRKKVKYLTTGVMTLSIEPDKNLLYSICTL